MPRYSPYDGRPIRDYTIVGTFDMNLHPLQYDAMEIASRDSNGNPTRIDYYELASSGSYTASFTTLSGSVSFTKIMSSFLYYSASAMINTYCVRLV